MSEFPKDICDTTNDIIAKHNSVRGDDLCVMIARAILAERERAARIADETATAWVNGRASTSYGQAYQTACDRIAAAIRASR